jgi:sugar lactone lactonase YvrE
MKPDTTPLNAATPSMLMKKLYLCFLVFALIGTLIPDCLHAAAGDLYVADASSNNAIAKYNPAGTRTIFASGINAPAGLAFDSKGNVYVTEQGYDQGGSNVLKFTPGGTKSTFASGFSLPQGMAFDGAGNLFVTEFFATTITKITPAGTKTPFASGLSNPEGLAFDSLGNLYEADYGSGNVFKFTPAGSKTMFASGFSAPAGPFGLAFDSAGNLFVTDYTAGTVSKVTPAGTKTTFATGIGGPRGIAFDGSGNLFVAGGSSSSILLFTPAGVRSTFTVGAGTPSFIAFEPVLHQFLNISTRAFVQAGDGVLIGGFILGGNGQVNCTIVARAIGPSLSAFGVPSTLQDPTLELRDGTGALVAKNDDWKSDQQAQIQATGLAPTNARESAILATLPAGNYTAIVRGLNNTTGNALVEVYNLQ